jgi:hypothetical protein
MTDMGKRRDKLRADLGHFFKGYGRTSRRHSLDPNDRQYDRKVEREIKRMDPVELDAILRGDDEPVSQETGFPCPCCGYLTLPEGPPGTFFICPVCWWEDDDVQFADPASEGGANRVSLRDARLNYARIGASEPRFADQVRPPRPEEQPVPP